MQKYFTTANDSHTEHGPHLLLLILNLLAPVLLAPDLLAPVLLVQVWPHPEAEVRGQQG